MSDDTDAAWAEQELQERHRREDEGLKREAELLADMKRSHAEFIACCQRFDRMMADRLIHRSQRMFK